MNIYLDNNATTPLAPEVLDAWLHGNAQAFFFTERRR